MRGNAWPTPVPSAAEGEGGSCSSARAAGRSWMCPRRCEAVPVCSAGGAGHRGGPATCCRLEAPNSPQLGLASRGRRPRRAPLRPNLSRRQGVPFPTHHPLSGRTPSAGADGQCLDTHTGQGRDSTRRPGAQPAALLSAAPGPGRHGAAGRGWGTAGTPPARGLQSRRRLRFQQAPRRGAFWPGRLCFFSLQERM